MSEITRLPIRRKGAFKFEDEIPHARVGSVEVIAARIVTTVGPETWGIILRSPGEPDAMPCTIQRLVPEGFGMALANLACAIEVTLRQALIRNVALSADGDGPPRGAA